MRSFYTCLLAGAVAAGGLGLGAYGETKAKDITVDQRKDAGNTLQQIGNQMADETTAQDVRNLLASAVNDAATQGEFEELVGYLAKPQRERMGDFKTPKTEDLNRTIAQFRADFKAKYNQEFALTPEHFRDAMVYAGKDKYSATVSLPELQLDRKLDGGTMLPLMDKKISGKMDKSMDKSIVPAGVKDAADRVTAGLTLNVINEGRIVSAWRISIPNEITAEQLTGNLKKHLQMFDDQKATWPADADAAYHAAAYHLLEALNDSALVSDR